MPLAAYSGPRLVLGRAALPLPRSAELALRHPPRTGPGVWRRGAGVVDTGGGSIQYTASQNSLFSWYQGQYWLLV